MRRLAVVVLLSLSLFAETASAALFVSDFQSSGDGMLFTDDATGIQWLSPVFSSSQSYNSIVAGWGDLVTTHEFTHASAQMVLDLFLDNFGTLPAGSPGSAAGFDTVQDIFDVFGVAEVVGCLSTLCPRTQGLTSDVSSPGSRRAIGVIQVGPNGWLLDISWSENDSTLQLGHWLVRAVPEPGLARLLGLGLVGIAARRKQKAS